MGYGINCKQENIFSLHPWNIIDKEKTMDGENKEKGVWKEEMQSIASYQ